MFGSSRKGSHSIVDLENARQIMAATSIYADQNGDIPPHPGWGLNDSPCWAYAPSINNSSNNVVPVSYIPDGIGNGDLPEAPNSAYQRQLPYFYAGQLAPMLHTPKTLMCSKDVVEIASSKRSLWKGRSLKLTSYSWNTATIDFGSRFFPHRISEFRPLDILVLLCYD